MVDTLDATKKLCPHCQRQISKGAKKCPECQSDLRSWFSRHPIITTIGVLFILGSVIGAVNDSSSSSATSQGTTNAPKEETWAQVSAFKGKGNQNTESFDVTGSKVRITATTTGSSVGSYSGVSLEKEDGGYTGPGLSISTDGSEPGKGQTTYRSLKPGRYFVQVISGVNWQVTVEQTN